MANPIRSTSTDGGTVTVTLLGEIDFSNADEVADGIREAVAEWQPIAVRVDLKDAAFIDSTGLGALIEGYRAATEAQSTFEVVDPTLNFRRVLAVTGLTELFGLASDDPAERPAIDFETTEATGA